jgi:hypothetical protein
MNFNKTDNCFKVTFVSLSLHPTYSHPYDHRITLQCCKYNILYHKHIVCRLIQSKVSILLNVLTISKHNGRYMLVQFGE